MIKSGFKPLFDVIIRLIENISEFIVNIGGLLTDIAAELGPWFAPLSPAMFSYMHLTGLLGFETWAAIPVAASIEFVGLAVTNTMITVWVGNRRNRAEKDKIPLRPLLGIFGWYLMTVLMLNVALAFADMFLKEDALWQNDMAFGLVVIGVQAALVLMEVPAAATIGFRRTYRNLLDDIAETKAARTESRKLKLKPKPETESRTGSKKAMVKELLAQGGNPTIAEIRDYFANQGVIISVGTISEARKEYNAFS